MPPRMGLILTSAPSLTWISERLKAANAAILKVIPAWGIEGGWNDTNRPVAARLARELVVRTVAGDPSAGQPNPLPGNVLAEIRPWYAARDPARPFWIEIGNEPLLEPTADEHAAWQYRWHLHETISLCRAQFPAAKLIAPAHILNHAISLGPIEWGQRRFMEICADAYRLCDAVALHSYEHTQFDRGRVWLRDLKLDMPIWVTEANINRQLAPIDRGHILAGLWRSAPADAVILYHLAAEAGDDPMHFNKNYELDVPTLQALAAAWLPPADVQAPHLGNGIGTDPDARHYPAVRVAGFTMDVRQWRTVAAFRRHLAQYEYRTTAPWAKGCVIHHTYRPEASGWRGVRSMEALARFYRHEVQNPDGSKGGWTTGPQLFTVGGSPNPDDDGIWQLSPLNLPGTHAGAANRTLWGIEHVGDFTRVPMPPDTLAFGAGAAAALLDWAGLQVTTATISPHAAHGKPACPGAGVDMAAYRRAVSALKERR